MKEIKGAVKLFIMSAVLIIISTLSAFAQTGKEDVSEPLRLRLYNEGFEEPVIEGNYKQMPASNVPYWRTTAYNTSLQIELIKQNNKVHLSSGYFVPRSGLQAAEINSDEASTLYQYVYGSPGSVYEWGISHHGRDNYNDEKPEKKDVMAIFIGPRQHDDNNVTIDPVKATKAGKDQFMKTVDWITGQSASGLDISKLDFGECKAFEVYTAKFAANGEFEGGDENAISFTPTETHTEKWHVWIIVSDNDAWYDYGITAAEDCVAYGDNGGYNTYTGFENKSYESNNTFDLKYKKPDYNYSYTVPAGSDGTIYAYCAYETASAQTNKEKTIGNIIDYARFSVKSPVRVTTTDFGSAETTISDENAAYENVKVNSGNPFNTYTAAGNTIELSIKPETACKFIGVYVNNVWIPAPESASEDNKLIHNNDGTYTYSDTVTDGMNSFHVVFAKYPYIIHSPNGGTYNGIKADTAEEITGAATRPYSDSPTIDNGEFAYWSIAGTDVTVGANHTVVVEETGDAGKYNITVKNESGETAVTITDTDVVVLIAHYKYPQKVNIYTMVGGKWKLSDTGGGVTISCSDSQEEISDSNDGATKTVYVEDNTEITVTANPSEDYHLERIVSDTTVQKESTYVYYSVGPREISVYYISGKRKPIVAFIDENGEGSYVLDTNTNTRKEISDKGGAYGNTVSTAFTAFWAGDETTYTHIQWMIDISFDADTLLKKNSLTADFNTGDLSMNEYKVDTDTADEKFRGTIYRYTGDASTKQLVISFPTTISGLSEIYSTIILDGIYSPNSTAELLSVPQINAEENNLLSKDNAFSVVISGEEEVGNYKTDSGNYYNN